MKNLLMKSLISTKEPQRDEYTQFVETVRRFEYDGEDTPVETAIDYCIGKHILEEFLRERRAEVLKAMTIDMTFERREELIREEEREEGRKQGREEERINTERERERAERATKQAENAAKRAEKAEQRIAELEAQLAAKGSAAS